VVATSEQAEPFLLAGLPEVAVGSGAADGDRTRRTLDNTDLDLKMLVAYGLLSFEEGFAWH
jgi:hypothetical protein